MSFARAILPDCCRCLQPGSCVANVGPGPSDTATQAFLDHGCLVDSIDISGRAAEVCDDHMVLDMDFMDLSARYDAIWAAHVLEHQRNPGAFLDHCWDCLEPGGWLFVTVPPLKHEIVGGHVTLWNMGLLIYHLILAGFDARRGSYLSHGYNLSAAVQRPAQRPELPELLHDAGDIEALAEFWPPELGARQGFPGNHCVRLNWPPMPESH